MYKDKALPLPMSSRALAHQGITPTRVLGLLVCIGFISFLMIISTERSRLEHTHAIALVEKQLGAPELATPPRVWLPTKAPSPPRARPSPHATRAPPERQQEAPGQEQQWVQAKEEQEESTAVALPPEFSEFVKSHRDTRDPHIKGEPTLDDAWQTVSNIRHMMKAALNQIYTAQDNPAEINAMRKKYTPFWSTYPSCEARQHPTLMTCESLMKPPPPDAPPEEVLFRQQWDEVCANKTTAPYLDVRVDCRYVDNYYRYADKWGWIEEGFTLFAGGNQKYVDMAILTAESVHMFTDRPIVLLYFTRPEDRAKTDYMTLLAELPPEEYPQLIILHADKMGTSPMFEKQRVMALSKVRTGIAFDGDMYITSNRIVRLFAATRREVTAQYPLPVLPVHWDTRDPNANYFKYAFNYTGVRTMRWSHAHPSWTWHALPFIVKRVLQPAMFETHVWPPIPKSDETALNVALWRANATKQWCKWQMEETWMANHFLLGKTSCCAFGDNTWGYEKGLAVMFYAVHNAKNTTASKTTIRAAVEANWKNNEHIFFDKKKYHKEEEVPKQGRACIM